MKLIIEILTILALLYCLGCDTLKMNPDKLLHPPRWRESEVE